MASSRGSTPTIPGGKVGYVPSLPDGDSEDTGFRLSHLGKILHRRRRIFLLTLAGVTLASGLVTLYKRFTSPVFQGGFSILIADPVRDPGGAQSGDSGSIASVARNVSANDVPTLIKVLESPAVLDPVFRQLQKETPESPLPVINVSLVAASENLGSPILAAGVLGVQARGGDPALVRRALQLTEQTYLSWALQQRRQKLTEAVRFLEQQSPVLQAKSSELQSELQRFRTTQNMLQPMEEATAMRAQVETLRTQLLGQQAEKQRLIQLRSDVASGNLTARGFNTSSSDAKGPSQGSATTLEVNVPNQALLEELNKLEVEIADARSKYQPGTPLLENLLAARDRLRPALQQKELEAVDAALRQYDSSITSTKQQIDRLQGRFQTQPALLRQYEDLERRLKIAETNLASYLSTRDQFQLEIAQNNVPWKVIAPTTVNPVPVEPPLGQGLLQGLLLGLVAGTGVALLRDRLDHVFHSPSEVRDELKEPLLGHIPYISFFEGVRREKRFLLQELDEQQGGAGGYQRFYYQEAFRNLYTSLRFLNSDKPLRSVALTSSVPAEGKSLTSVLLAKTLSEVGRKVLLVDADLRKPQIHTRLGLNNLEGLTNLLTEEGRSWQEVVQSVPNYANWDVITAGLRAPDPPRLLSSARMAKLVQEIAHQGGYDLILYDTPPALGLADAALVAEQLDGIVLVVSLNRVDRSLPSQAIQRIQSAGAPLLGVVTNARVAGETSPSGYGYGYGYGRHSYDASYRQGDLANDPGLAYGYYSSESDPAPKAQQGFSAVIPTRSNLGRWRKAVTKWIDG